ncbi:MAG: SDR family NAD(P)-dependent oxidoreductase [Dehalococcoidia bacterium]|nr:SDR family NAD(P)-dependent oxidoreductase [Dehalococcoidia bacterium]
MGTLDGKVIIITGGGTGLGRSMALCLAAEGADIVVAARRKEPLEETARGIRKLGRKALVVPTDVTDPTQCNALIEKTLAEMGKIDVLINNAGIVRGERRVPLWEITDESWHTGIDVNLSSVFYCSRAVSKYFADKKSGKIINVASGEGFRGQRDSYMYNTAKAGVVNLTRVMAMSLAEYNIRVNCIVPGFVDTFEYQPEEYQQAMAQLRATGGTRRLFIPIGHTGKPDDIGYLALFLCSDASDYVTATPFICDGGGLTGGFATTGYAPVVSLKEALA